MNDIEIRQPIDYQKVGDITGYLYYQPNFLLNALLDSNTTITFLGTGNQVGKTSSVIVSYVMRILGKHPVESKNMRPNNPFRTIRFASVKLPMETNPNGEVYNPIYPALKKFLPPSLIKKDITLRKPVITLRDPQGGADIFIEFVSYNQDTDTQKGFQKFSVFLDEEAPKDFYVEQLPRLLSSNGDLIFALTPDEGMSWAYEDLYEKAGIVYNSPTIIDYLYKKTGKKHLSKEIRNEGNKDISLILAATDDNPTMALESIERLFAVCDLSTVERKRYGIFSQISGAILRDFDDDTHVINRNKYFPEGLPHEWLHTRGIDFHEHVNWACGFMALSQANEAFIYDEFNPSPDNMITLQIVRELAIRSRDYKYGLNLIDPWADKTQTNTGLSPLQDINRMFREFSREGLGTGGYWQTWDTKSLRGRDLLKERLKNSLKVGRPFCNRVPKGNGLGEEYLPTLWILDNCFNTIQSFKHWRWEEPSKNDPFKQDKNKPEDRFSHFPITYECIMKHPAFSGGRFRNSVVAPRPTGYENYMKSRRIA